MDAHIQFEPFVDANTVAAHLKITRRQTLEMTRRGLLPGYPLGTGLDRKIWRYRLSEIDALVTAGSKNAPGPATGQCTKTVTISVGSPRSRKGTF